MYTYITILIHNIFSYHETETFTFSHTTNMFMPPNVSWNIYKYSAISDWRRKRTYSEEQLENFEVSDGEETSHIQSAVNPTVWWD